MTSAGHPRGPHSARRRALVTGASVGIGEAFAARLAKDHYDLVIVARSRDRLDILADQLRKAHHVHVGVLAADLTKAADLRRVEERVAGERSLDLLVNNAGFGTTGRFADLDVDREEDEIRLNVLALVRLTRAALPGMIARGHGGIINVSSMSGFQPGPYTATYGGTKAFVNSFTEALSEELRGTGVKVQALCPGFTRTEFQERAGLDVSAIPSFAWMGAEAVVDASVAALERDQVICVPGIGNRLLATLGSSAPRRISARLLGAVMKRAGTR